MNSDHVPCNLCVRVKLNFAMNSLQDISSTFYSYDHHDKSRIAGHTIHLSSANCGKLIKEFDILAEKLIVEINDINTDTDQIEEKTDEALHEACMKCKEIIKTPTPHTQNVDPGRIFDSQNNRAMAEANYLCITYC